jgi:heat shock protein HslJ
VRRRIIGCGVVMMVAGGALTGAVVGASSESAGSGVTTTSLEGPTWVLDQKASNLEVIAPQYVVTATFDNGNLSGSSGCNRYNTTYTARGSRLSVSRNISSTLIACNQDASNVESSYIARLPTARTFSISDGRLTVRTTTKGADLIYRARSARALVGDWQVTSYFRPGAVVSVAAGTTITASFNRRAISGNAGCNDYSGPYKTDDTKIRIGPVSSTQRACAQASITQQESEYLAALDTVRTFGTDAHGLTLFRADGGIAVTMTRP